MQSILMMSIIFIFMSILYFFILNYKDGYDLLKLTSWLSIKHPTNRCNVLAERGLTLKTLYPVCIACMYTYPTYWRILYRNS